MQNPLRLLVACGVMCLCLTGCLVSHDSSVSRSGRSVAATTLAQMKPGTTTDEWARAVIGEPTSIRQLKDGTEIWRWDYSEQTTSHGTVFLLFQSNQTDQQQSAVLAEFKDGVLVRWWQG